MESFHPNYGLWTSAQVTTSTMVLTTAFVLLLSGSPKDDITCGK
jgi:hypothetical protein